MADTRGARSTRPVRCAPCLILHTFITPPVYALAPRTCPASPAHTAGVVTSGELAHRYLTSRPDAWWAGLGTRVLHINWSRRGAASLDGYGLEVRGRGW